MGVDGSSDNGGFDLLPDDILINILSRMSLNESARTSVLARRWINLWMFAHKTLRFNHRDAATGNVIGRKKFESCVNKVVELHQTQYIEGLVVRLEEKKDRYRITPTTYDKWMFFAMQKDVRRFELNLSFDNIYKFPSVERLRSHSHGVSAPLCHLRTLRLAHVDIDDETVHYFLGSSCPNLEYLCIHSSILIENLQVIDPPCLRVLEISRCPRLKSLKIFAEDLFSLTYRGPREILLLEKIPNLRELTICDDFCLSFVTKPEEHWSYSVQLEKLVLDFRLTDYGRLENLPYYLPQLCSLKRLEVFTVAGRTLFIFRSLIKASPQLREFRIEMSYSAYSSTSNNTRIPYRGSKFWRKGINFINENLKVVEVGGYRGFQGERELVLALIKIGPSIERVVIDTEMDYFGIESYISLRRRRGLKIDFCGRQTETARNEAKECAKHFASKVPRQIKYIVT